MAPYCKYSAFHAIDVLKNKITKCHSDLWLLQGYKLETKDYGEQARLKAHG